MSTVSGMVTANIAVTLRQIILKSDSQWEELNVFCSDGAAPIDVVFVVFLLMVELFGLLFKSQLDRSTL
jgi:hypothetical protein